MGSYIIVFYLLNNSGFDGFKMYAGPALSPMAVILIFDIFRDKLKICVNILSKLFCCILSDKFPYIYKPVLFGLSWQYAGWRRYVLF